jgi:flagellar hook-associated protein 3 FlgL
MRINTYMAFETSVSQLQSRQTALSRAQEQLTSGKRVDRPSDDPAAAARAERALAAIGRADASQRALDTSRNAMALTESALGDAGEMLQQARELVISAGNGSLTDIDRRTLAEAIRGLRNDLLAVANRGDGGGRYLFGGQGSDGPPLVDDDPNGTGVTYHGTGGEQLASAGEITPLSLDGYAAFLSTPDPANATQPLSVFTALDRVINGLLTPGQTPTQVAALVSTGLGDIDATGATLAQWRSRAGESLNRLDGIESRLGQAKLNAQTERSNAEDLDLIAAISDFQNQQTGYDAALKMFSTVQRLTLFDYLK